MSDQFYYIDASKERVGPILWTVLEQLHKAGAVTDQTLVAPEGGSEWKPFSELKAHREMQASLPPVPGSTDIPTSSQPKATGNEAISPANSPHLNNGSSQLGESVRTEPIQWQWALILYSINTAIFLIYDLGAFTGNEKIETIFGNIGIVFTIPTVVIICILHYQCWHTLPVRFRVVSPGKAVGFLFIPFYNFYWAFVTWPKLTDGFKRWQDESGVTAPVDTPHFDTDTKALAMAYACLFVASFILGLFPLTDIPLEVASLFVFGLYYRQTVKTANCLISGDFSAIQKTVTRKPNMMLSSAAVISFAIIGNQILSNGMNDSVGASVIITIVPLLWVAAIFWWVKDP